MVRNECVDELVHRFLCIHSPLRILHLFHVVLADNAYFVRKSASVVFLRSVSLDLWRYGKLHALQYEQAGSWMVGTSEANHRQLPCFLRSQVVLDAHLTYTIY